MFTKASLECKYLKESGQIFIEKGWTERMATVKIEKYMTLSIFS